MDPLLNLSLTLTLLTILQLVHGSEAAGTNNYVLVNNANSHDQTDGPGTDHHGHVLHFHDHSASDHDRSSDNLMNNPSSHVFFTLNDLKLNNTMKLYFPTTKISKSPSHFLPQEEANSIPFSSTQLPYLLNLFSIPQNSSQAKTMEETLSHCERRPIKGETKTCATSLESMLEFVHKVFEPNPHIRALTTKYSSTKKSRGKGGGLVKYRIASLVEVVDDHKGSKVVACHIMAYPYAVFYFHYLEKGTKVFRVGLQGLDIDKDERVDAVVICHMDTSGWNKNHASFLMLGIKPGSGPVCHVFPADNIVWVPLLSHDGSKQYM